MRTVSGSKLQGTVGRHMIYVGPSTADLCSGLTPRAFNLPGDPAPQGSGGKVGDGQ